MMITAEAAPVSGDPGLLYFWRVVISNLKWCRCEAVPVEGGIDLVRLRPPPCEPSPVER
jgi:hypothetical protein